MTTESLLDNLETSNKFSKLYKCVEHNTICQTISPIFKLTKRFCDVCIGCRSTHLEKCSNCKLLVNLILNGNSFVFN